MEVCLIGTGVIPIPPTYGGATERVIFELGCALAKLRGVEVRIIDYEHEIPETPKNLEYVMIDRRMNLVRKHSFFSLLALLRSASLQSDIFHCSLAISSILFSKARGRTIYTSHSPFWFDPDRFNKTEIYAIRNAACSIAISTDIYEKMKHYNSRTEYVPNGVNVDKFKPPKKRETSPKVLFVGRISEQKGLEYLVDAVGRVKRDVSDVEVHCIGPTSFYGDVDSEYSIRLQKLISEHNLEDNFIFTRKVSEQELLKHYRESALFVLPSVSEGMTLVVLEALACGLPVVATNVSGVRDVVDDDVGRIVPKRDSAALAKRMAELLSDSSLMRNMSKNARERAEMFSWERIAKKTVAVYKKVVGL